MTALVPSRIIMYAKYASIGYAGYPLGDVPEK